ncbi:MAG: hypothetical protein ACE5GN_04240, partial [Waddliaceae bacterium]
MKFRNLKKVLAKLEQTLRKPKLWGDHWNKKVYLSGRITDYKFKEIAPDLNRYLTDGSLKMSFRLTKKTFLGAPGGQTVNKNHIILFQIAGAVPNEKRLYSDYHLARTVFHELMHVWQYYYWTFVGRFMDVETFPTKTEKWLPTARFSTKKFPDPRGTTPVP